MVQGPGEVTLKDVTFRTRSNSDAGIYAHRGGKVTLLVRIRLNEHLHDEAPDESFCGIIATDHGSVRFGERAGAVLEIGNGSLSASYWGAIRLGCERATITSWGRQSNNLAVNNSGRIDLHDTETTLRAKVPENTPIGPEHDGHILAEGAHIIIDGTNDCAISLQKARRTRVPRSTSRRSLASSPRSPRPTPAPSFLCPTAASFAEATGWCPRSSS